MTADPEVEEQTEFTFAELDDQAKERAREHARDWDVGHDWWDYTYEDAARMAELMGIQINTRSQRRPNLAGPLDESPDISFSGFCSQGDGASFSGKYRCEPEAVKKIKAECSDEELIAIAEALSALQVRCKMTWNTTVACKVFTYGNYSHSGTMDVTDVYWDDDTATDADSDGQGLGDELVTLMRRFADWIYKQLEAKYNYLTSDEHVDENLRGLKFDADGAII
jgi:hypothetical protein